MSSPKGQQKKFETSTAEITLRNDGIFHVEFKENAVIDLEQQEENRLKFIEITENVRSLFVYTSHAGVVITKEARENARKLEKDTPMLAVAIVTRNLAYRLLADFYARFHKPHIPYKVFGDMDKAIIWLNSFR